VQPAKVTVRLRQDKGWFPDRTLAEESDVDTDVELTVLYKCNGTGSQSVFTEIIVEEGRKWVFFRKTLKARSPNVAATLCG
jgi:hypothetical protein